MSQQFEYYKENDTKSNKPIIGIVDLNQNLIMVDVSLLVNIYASSHIYFIIVVRTVRNGY